jgi:integrase
MAKRSHGDGGLDQRGENIYRLRYRVGGKRYNKTFHGTLTDARRELRRLLKSSDDGDHVAPAKKTLAEWANEWIKLKAAERRAKTVARYAELLTRHVLPKIGDRPLQHIKPIEIQLLYAELNLAPRTKHHVATVLKTCLQAAVDVGKVLQVNPAAAIKKPTVADSDVGQALEQDKITALVEGFRGSTLFDLVFLMAFTGMRRSEVLGLRWSDFNPATKTLRIEQTVEYTKRRPLRFEAPKSDRGRRTITLDDTLVALLMRRRSRYDRIVAGIPDGAGDVGVIVKIPDDWLIFHAPDGDMNAPRHPDAITKQFCQRARKVLGFKIRLHDLRVSHGTWLLDQGTPVHVVAKRLGHDAHVLLKIYAKRTQKSDESAAATIGAMTKGLSI